MVFYYCQQNQSKDSRAKEDIIMKNKIPSNWKNCATCSRWCGRKNPDAFCNFVEYDMNEKARCAGGGFNNAKMNGQQSCSKWTQQFFRK